MRSIYLVVLLTMLVQVTFAQWNPNGATSGSIYYNGGYVGIGRDIPAFKLDVLGTIRSYGDLRTSGVGNNNGYYADDGVGSTIFSITRQANNETRFQSYGYHTFYSGGNSGTERMRISGDGKIGIGVINPYSHSKVHIKADINSPWTILAESSTNGGVIGMSHSGDAGQISVSYLGSGTFSPLQFRTSNLERMTILADGRIGIGTSSPESTLDVYSPTNSTIKIRNESYTNGYAELKLETKRSASPGNSSGLIANASGAPLNGIPSETFGIYSRWRPMVFAVGNGDGNVLEYMRISQIGNVGIGTTAPTQKLTVKGTVYSTEVKVDVNAGTGPDYVFEPSYNLPTLAETEAYIKVNKHLPEVPSAKEMEANGINLSEMNMLLLKKVEELTLHLIQATKSIKNLEDKVQLQEIEITQLKKN